MDALVQFARAGEIVAKRLFDHDALPALRSGVAQSDCAQNARPPRRSSWAEWKDNTERWSGQRRQFVLDGGVEFRVTQIAGNVVQTFGEAGPLILVKGAVFQELLHGIVHLAAKLIVAEGRARGADDRGGGGQTPLIRQPVKRRNQLAFGEIAIGSEDNDGAFGNLAFEAEGVGKRVGVGHVVSR